MNRIYYELENINDIYNLIEEKTKSIDNRDDILLILDIDNTITYTKCPYVYWPNIRNNYDFYIDLQKKFEDIDINLVYLDIILSSDLDIYDKDIFKITNDFNSKKICLTATITGSYLDCPDVVKYRYEYLKNKGIDFNKYFNINPENKIIFDNLNMYVGSYPEYYKGILFSNSEKGPTNKGMLLNEFLIKTNYYPKHIILIDDSKRNHENMYIELQKLSNIENFISILYTGVYEYCPQIVSKDDFEYFWTNKMLKASNELNNKIKRDYLTFKKI